MRQRLRAASLGTIATTKRKLTALLVLAVVAACGDSSAAPNAPHVLGTYSLTAVNGAALPTTVKIDSINQTFTSGSLTVTDSSYQFAVCVQSPGTTSACGADHDAILEYGHWYATGMNLVFLHDTDTSSETAKIGTGTLTVPFGKTGVQFSFLQQQ